VNEGVNIHPYGLKLTPRSQSSLSDANSCLQNWPLLTYEVAKLIVTKETFLIQDFHYDNYFRYIHEEKYVSNMYSSYFLNENVLKRILIEF
jgi:hypothetical protein